jgi:hypothetical protein
MYKNNLLSFNPRNLVFNAKIYPEKLEINKRINNTYYNKIIGINTITNIPKKIIKNEI